MSAKKAEKFANEVLTEKPKNRGWFDLFKKKRKPEVIPLADQKSSSIPQKLKKP